MLRPGGTRVRCSVCDHRWTAFPEDPGEPTEPASAPEELRPEAPTDAPAPERGDGRSRQPARKGGRAPAVLLKLLVLALVLGLLLELGYAFRSQWLAWPWARSAVAGGLTLAGWDVELPIALSKYRVDAVHARRLTLTSGRHVTLVQGLLTNGASFAQRPPRLELSALGPGQQVRFRRLARPGQRMDLSPPVTREALAGQWLSAQQGFPAEMDPGQEIPFVVVLEDVPPGIKRFRVQMRE
jgi:hypothetical protein